MLFYFLTYNKETTMSSGKYKSTQFYRNRKKICVAGRHSNVTGVQRLAVGSGLQKRVKMESENAVEPSSSPIYFPSPIPVLPEISEEDGGDRDDDDDDDLGMQNGNLVESEDEEDDGESLGVLLSDWAVRNAIRREPLRELIALINKFVPEEQRMAKDPRTLMGTPKTIIVSDMDGGKF